MIQFLILRKIQTKNAQISHYSGDLKSDLVRISNDQKEFGLQMVRILNGIWNPTKMAAILYLPFEIRTF